MRPILILFLFFASQSLMANQIDSLKTDQDVLVFLKKVNKRLYEKNAGALKLLPTDSLRHKLACDGIFEQWHVKNWEKADFNADGNTDLVVIPYWYNFDVFVVMDNGDGSFDMEQLSKDVSASCKLAKPFKIDDQQLLAVYRKISVPDTNLTGVFKEVQQVDTLIYKFGGFIEWNKRPANYRIKLISYSTTHCFGTCPVFSIDVYPNAYARYMAIDNNPKNGDFEAQLSNDAFDELLQLINYLDVKRLKDSYQVGWTDDQTALLKVQFRDGTTKNIRDYGLTGTFGLSRLYAMFAELRLNQEWE